MHNTAHPDKISYMSIHGLYAIADCAVIEQKSLYDTVLLAIDGGATAIQYRAKNISMQRQVQDAAMLASLCRQHGVLCIVNDEPLLAKQVGADGVHIGRDG